MPAFPESAATRCPMLQDNPQDLAARLDRLEMRIGEIHALMVGQRKIKDFYSTAEVAEALGKAEFTVREWCRHGRVRAEKRSCGRGNSQEWMISHDELTRIRNKGLLPLRKD